MFSKSFTMAVLAVAIALSPAIRANAGGNDIVGGVIGGIIGGAIVNEAAKNREKQRRARPVYRSTTSSATRAQNRDIQTSLNYFGFPSGPPDGVIGRQTRGAISQYQAHMGYPVTGQLTLYEKDFLVGSYYRAVSGGAATNQLIASNPQGARGLLYVYRDEAAGIVVAQPGAPQVVTPAPQTTVVVAPQAAPSGTTTTTTTTVTELAPDSGADAGVALPNFLGGGEQLSLASHCNTISLLTNTNGGFTTADAMVDANFALNEQFCLARTYAIAQGEDLASKVQGFTPQQIAAQCESFGPAMKDHVAALSLKGRDEVMRDVSGFVLKTGMAPQQLAGTAKICLSAGYRTDNMDVAIGSALLLTVLGEQVYGELMGHHLAQGFGASRRSDLALAWYEMGLNAIDNGATAVFAPGQPERNDLIRKAALQLGGGGDQAGTMTAPVQPASALPTFNLEQ